MGTLELISSQNCPIRSLAVANKPDTPFILSRFQNLNLSQLQEMALNSLQWDQSRGIMDLALKSNCRNMTFSLNHCPPTPDLFRHELIQRVVDMVLLSRQ
jgi:hypothetical protein